MCLVKSISLSLSLSLSLFLFLPCSAFTFHFHANLGIVWLIRSTCNLIRIVFISCASLIQTQKWYVCNAVALASRAVDWILIGLHWFNALADWFAQNMQIYIFDAVQCAMCAMCACIVAIKDSAIRAIAIVIILIRYAFEEFPAKYTSSISGGGRARMADIVPSPIARLRRIRRGSEEHERLQGHDRR